MADFAEALMKGFVAAEQADLSFKEIAKIFDDLRKQVLTATDGKVCIERMEFEIAESGWPVTFMFPPKAREKYWAIAAFNPNVGRNNASRLAHWSADRSGYPCRITWNKKEYVCQDAEALEQCLAQLLSDPDVGHQIHTISKLEPAK